MQGIPSLKEAERLLLEAAALNPGGWVEHSRYVAQGARALAQAHPRLDGTAAFVLGLLHDIGRREGSPGMRHILDGYTFMTELGHERVARVCLTHSFPLQDFRSASSGWEDCTPEEIAFVSAYLESVVYDDYDRLLQLCDALAMSDGFTLLEQRMLDVVYRYGPNPFTVRKWAATFALRDAFEATLGHSIYRHLPGVVANTFGYDPCS